VAYRISFDDLLNATPHHYKTTAEAWGKWREAVTTHANGLRLVNQHVSANWGSVAASEASAFIDARHLKATTAAGVLDKVSRTLSSAYSNFADAHNKLVATVSKAKANGFDCAGGHVTDTRPYNGQSDSQATQNRASLMKTYQADIDAALREATAADNSAASALRGLVPGKTDLAGGNGTGTGTDTGSGHGTPAAPVDYSTSGNIPVPPNFANLAPNPRAQQVLNFAKSKLGLPYIWGGNGPRGYDCSGLTQHAYAAAGISIPRTSEEQWSAGPHITPGHEQPGDLVFFHPDGAGRPGHVGIVLDPKAGTMIEAPHTGDVIKIYPYKNYPGGVLGFVRPH
jgi:cell wall-associated NlpC family hydrolase